MNKIKVADLHVGYHIFGNKGTVWNNTAHIYESGKGILCGTPALSTNWAKIEGLEEIGCPECISHYEDRFDG